MICLTSAYPQFPPRLQIPGAVFVDAIPPKPATRSRARAQAPPQQQSYIPHEVRPVNEEPDDIPSPVRYVPSPAAIPVQHLLEVEPEQSEERERPQPPFRPERPIAAQRQIQYVPQPQQQPQQQQIRPKQNYAPVEIAVPHLRRPNPQPAPQQPRPAQQPRPVSRPAPQYLDDDSHRTRKPPVQILRKYRTDNADGSITWGYENEDGSFKEETIGIDCITRGKYGYVDPDGVKREYSYETGGTCEEPEEDLEDLPPGQAAQAPKGKKPHYKPLPQYVN